MIAQPCTLSALAAALSLPVHHPRPPTPCYIVFLGQLMGFQRLLEARQVAHEEFVDPVDGYGIRIAGMTVERGEMGGVMIRESATAQLGQFYPIDRTETGATGPIRSDYKGDVS